MRTIQRHETQGTRVTFTVCVHRSYTDGHYYRMTEVYTPWGSHLRTRIERVK